MSVFTRVSMFALGQLVANTCRMAGASAVKDGALVAARFVSDRLADHSLRVGSALATASERAWRTLEIALTGESLTTLTDRGEDRAFREQVRLFLLRAQFDGRAAADRDFLPRCLAELRAAREGGVFAGEIDPAHLGDLTRFSDPAALVAAEWMVADELATDLRANGFPTLAGFVALRPAGDPDAAPLLAVAVRYYFRRAIEDDPKLFQGLAFAQLERIGKAQESGTAQLAEQLTRVEERLGALHAALGSAPPAPAPVPPAAPLIPDFPTNGPVAVSPDGQLAVCGSPYDGKLRVFDAATRKELRRLAGHADWVTCLAFAPDGRTVASGGKDATVKLWDVATGRMLRTIRMKSVPAAIVFAPDGRVTVTCDDGREVPLRP